MNNVNVRGTTKHKLGFKLSLALCVVLFSQEAAWSAPMRDSAVPESRALTISSYEGGRDLIEDFVIEGISLNTPIDSVRDILVDRGYEEIFSSDVTKLEFIKNGRSPRALGDASFSITVLQRDGVHRLHFRRLTRVDPRASSPELPNSPGVKRARGLKKRICASITDETERWKFCLPDTDAKLSLGLTSQWLKLDDGLFIEYLKASPGATIIQLFSR